MEMEAQKLRRELVEVENRFNKLKEELKTYELSCQHNWDQKYTPVHHKGYTLPGDKPGTMGVDWRGPVYVESRTEEKWTRICKNCGLTQVTQRFENDVKTTKVPDWRGL